jgi:hypothetical protein
MDDCARTGVARKGWKWEGMSWVHLWVWPEDRAPRGSMRAADDMYTKSER